MNIIYYLKESREELKKVTWPDRQQLTRMTVAVIVISALTAIYLGLIDAALVRIIRDLVGKQ